MKLLRLVASLILFVSCAFAQLFPSNRVVDWTVGTYTGVDGGIQQYFDQANGGSVEAHRNTSDMVVVSADNTGSSNTHDQILAAWNSGLGNGIYFPLGVYKITSSIDLNYSAGRTMRGRRYAGQNFVRNTTSNAIAGSGTVTFTGVPTDVGWVNGDGIMAWDRFSPGQRWVRGTVSSYTGGSLSISVVESQGSGTVTDWGLSLVVILSDTGVSSRMLYIGGDANYITWESSRVDVLENPGYSRTIVADPISGFYPAKGDTQITIDTLSPDGSQLVAGRLVQFGVTDEKDKTTMETGDPSHPIVIGVGGSGTDVSANPMGDGTHGYLRRMLNRIVSRSGTTLTLEVPLQFALPARLGPRLWPASVSSTASYVGIEDIVFMGMGQERNIVLMQQCNNCWLYDVSAFYCRNWNVEIDMSYKVEINHSYLIDRNHFFSGTSGGAVLPTTSSQTAIIDSVAGQQFPGIELQNFNNSTVIAYCYGYGNDGASFAELNVNHGAHNSFTLIEGCVFQLIRDDGYHGSSSNSTFFRSWTYGDPQLPTGFFVLNRFAWYYNIVGNIMGTPSVYNGGYSFGNPNRGNGSNDGNTINPTTLNTWWQQFANGPASATVTNAGTGAVTLINCSVSDFGDSKFNGGAFGGMVFRVSGLAVGGLITGISGSGTSAILSVGAGSLPASGTIYFYTLQNGYQDLDLGTQDTARIIGNTLVSGSSWSQESTSGFTFPDSLAFSAKPWWWRNSLTYPAVNPASPTWSHDITPAGYRMVHGVEAPSSGSGNGTMNITGSSRVTGSVRLP